MQRLVDDVRENPVRSVIWGCGYGLLLWAAVIDAQPTVPWYVTVMVGVPAIALGHVFCVYVLDPIFSRLEALPGKLWKKMKSL